jgi:hypothetical protein
MILLITVIQAAVGIGAVALISFLGLAGPTTMTALALRSRKGRRSYDAALVMLIIVSACDILLVAYLVVVGLSVAAI